MQIWKWTLQVVDLQSLPIPDGAKLLTVQAQGDMPQLWALVDEKAPIVHRNVASYGTGHPMPDGDPGAYVGTYQIHGGALVFHVFEPFNGEIMQTELDAVKAENERLRVALRFNAEVNGDHT